MSPLTTGTVKKLITALLLSTSAIVSAQEAATKSADDLAKQLSNPLAALISVPIQYNYDETFGADGYKNYVIVQPVIPVSISQDWNLISRTVLPIVSQQDVIPGTDQFGLGDTVQSLFFSPKKPTASGLIWGIGPVAQLPTTTDDYLGADTWAVGATGVVLKQQGKWTIGALANHLVDVSGDAEISATYVQPFLSLILGKGRTLALNTESTYNWETEQWNVPINLAYSKVSKIGNQMVSYLGGVRGYVETPDGGPDWGVRFQLTLLYPKK